MRRNHDGGWLACVIVLLAIILALQIQLHHANHRHLIFHVRGYTCTEIHTNDFDCQKIEST